MSEPRHAGGSWRQALVSFLLVILTSGALYCGLFFFSTVRALAARSSLPFSDSQSVAPVNITQPGQSAEKRLPRIVEKQEPVSILVLGIDERSGKGPWLSDTMILVSVDPTSSTVSMLSIPRDLWVRIPGYGEGRINMAHSLGDSRGYPGGGPALAKKTVWNALGVPVHYYMRVNFTAFEKVVDAIGGLTIDVKKPIHDEQYPDDSYGIMTIDIPAGIQHMDGRTALQYARSRHQTSDFDRMDRQMTLILAARAKLLRGEVPLSRIPRLVELVGNSIKTDLSLDDILALAELARRIEDGQLHSGIIDRAMTTTVTTPDGWMVEVGDWDKIRGLVNELFPAPVPSVEPNAGINRSQLASESARVVVRNGTLTTALAGTTAQMLRDLGFHVLKYDNAERLDYSQSTIVDYAGKPYTVSALAMQLGVATENIRREPNGPPDTDVMVILGRDYAERAGRR